MLPLFLKFMYYAAAFQNTNNSPCSFVSITIRIFQTVDISKNYYYERTYLRS